MREQCLLPPPNSSSLFQQADSLFWGWLILLQFFFFFFFLQAPDTHSCAACMAIHSSGTREFKSRGLGALPCGGPGLLAMNKTSVTCISHFPQTCPSQGFQIHFRPAVPERSGFTLSLPCRRNWIKWEFQQVAAPFTDLQSSFFFSSLTCRGRGGSVTRSHPFRLLGGVMGPRLAKEKRR